VRHTAVRACVVVGWALIASACDRPPSRPAADNVLLLVVDTLRADHTSLYGYPRRTTPALERLAASAVVFEQARSQAACTFPSVNSLLTGRHPAEFLGAFYGDFSIPARLPTLAERLQERGWATFAASASAVVRATPSPVNLVGGFGRGFDRFDEHCTGRDAACLTARLGKFLDRRASRFFAYVHFMEPHHPYAPPPAHARRFATAGGTRPWILAGDPDPIERALSAGAPVDVTRAELAQLVDLYDDEIAYLDAQLDALFGDLARRHLLDRTLIVLAADHGEMFLEHGDIKHCRQLWDTVVRTPLVVWWPDRPGRRVTAPVENVDLVPTVLDALGVRVPDAVFDGRSLRPLLDGRADPGPRYAHGVQAALRSVTDGRYKLIVDVVAGTARLYDLARDPGEHEERGAVLPAERARLGEALAAHVTAHEGADAGARSAARAAEVERALRALGYVQ
jgi:arylsulfatase A-like enzyme